MPLQWPATPLHYSTFNLPTFNVHRHLSVTGYLPLEAGRVGIVEFNVHRHLSVTGYQVAGQAMLLRWPATPLHYSTFNLPTFNLHSYPCPANGGNRTGGCQPG